MVRAEPVTAVRPNGAVRPDDPDDVAMPVPAALPDGTGPGVAVRPGPVELAPVT